jgi:hypothetical protein
VSGPMATAPRLQTATGPGLALRSAQQAFQGAEALPPLAELLFAELLTTVAGAEAARLFLEDPSKRAQHGPDALMNRTADRLRARLTP